MAAGGMCRRMAGTLRNDPSGPAKAPETASSLKRAAREALSSWRSEGILDTSGCDSSDCAYCQALAWLRQPGGGMGGSAAGCWLRRKRSRTVLVGLTDGGANGSEGNQDGGPLSRVPSGGSMMGADGLPSQPFRGQPSMWDHALLIEKPTAHSTAPAAEVAAAVAAMAPAESKADLGRGPRRRARRPSSSGAMAAATNSSSSNGSEPGGLSSSSGRSWSPSWQSPAALHEMAAFVPPGPYRHRQDIVCALEFEEHHWLLATAGVSKQVRVYSLASCLQHPEEASFREPIRCQRMASKLSSLAWNPDAPGAVTVADYDGMVIQVDLESGHLIAEVDEHCGRRVWSVSHSLHRRHLCASASDDGTVRLWGSAGMQECVAALHPARGAPATGVHLSPFDGDLAAVACADHSAYVYDLRRADQPLLQLSGHERAVSYVRWLAAACLVTASTDASLAIWQLPAPSQATEFGEVQQQQDSAGGSLHVLTQPRKRLAGHYNSKNFIGLSVRPEDGLVACGSESPACFAYHDSWAAPLATHSFGSPQLPSGPGASCSGSAPGSPALTSQQALDADQFCSAVCWQPATARLGGAPLLVAAMSNGDLRVLELRRPLAAATAWRCTDAWADGW